MFPILRDATLENARLGVRDGASRLRALAERRHGRRTDDGDRGTIVSEVGLRRLPCRTSHGAWPVLGGIVRAASEAANGRERLADEDYIRESILKPEAKLTAGYAPIMPTFKGIVNEEGLLQLIAYIKSLPAKQEAVSR